MSRTSVLMVHRSLHSKGASGDPSDDVPSINTGENISFHGSSYKDRSFNRFTRQQHNAGSQSTDGSYHATGRSILNPSLSQTNVTTSNASDNTTSDTSVTSSVLDESLIRELTEVGHLWGNVASVIFCRLGTGWYQLTTLIIFLNVFFLTRCLPKIRRFFLLLTPVLLLLGLCFWGFQEYPAQKGTSLYDPGAAKVPNPALAPESDVLSAPGEKGMNFLSDAHRISEIENHLAAIAAEQTRQKEEHEKMMVAIAADQILQKKEHEKMMVAIAADQILQKKEHEKMMVAIAADQILQKKEHEEMMVAIAADLILQKKEHEEMMVAIAADKIRQKKEHEEMMVAIAADQILQKKEREEMMVAIAADQSREMEKYGKMILKIQQQVVQLSDRSQADSPVKEHESRIFHLETLVMQLSKALEERQEEAQPRTCGSEIKDTDNGLLLRIQDLETQVAEHNAAILKEKTAQMNYEHADCVLQKVDAKVRESIQKTFSGNENVSESPLQLHSTKYMSEDDFTTKLQEMKQKIHQKMTHPVSMARQQPTPTVIESAVAGGAPGITEEEARVIVNNALKLYSQDRTGLVDFALESAGAHILKGRCSETYETKTSVLSYFGFQIWSFSNSPRVVIQPAMYPGDCWAMKGSQGYLAVRLTTRIYPTAFSIEHIPKALSPTGNITSAPKDFAVYGLEDADQQEGTLLVRNVYDDSGEPLQIFHVMEENQKSFPIVELQILSNWGHTSYTCLYRFRAHGTPVK